MDHKIVIFYALAIDTQGSKIYFTNLNFDLSTFFIEDRVEQRCVELMHIRPERPKIVHVPKLSSKEKPTKKV